MPAQRIWEPSPRIPYSLDQENIEVPPPLSQSDTVKPTVMARLMPIVMVCLMLGMIALMLTMRSASGGMSPFMLMMPLMMVMGLVGQFMSSAGGNDQAELNNERKEYALELRELRKKSHKQGEELHTLQEISFPNPHTLVNYIGEEDHKGPVMWQYTKNNKGGLILDEGTVDEVSFTPYMSARLGLGTTNLLPVVKFDELNVPETLEPVTTQMFRAFVRTQGFVTNMPIALNLASAPAFALEGSKDAETVESIYGLARAMLVSLAFNHSPRDLRIAIITDNVEDERWEWAKWLPHCQHPTDEDKAGSARLLYSSLVDFAAACPEALQPVSDTQPRWIVFVDKPKHEIRPPVRTGFAAGAVAATFIVVQAGADYLATSKRARYTISADRVLTLPGGQVQLAADYMTVDETKRFARNMAGWKPASETSFTDVLKPNAVRFKKKNWFEVLGIDDISEWDPTLGWAQTENTVNFEIPIGYAREGESLKEGLVTLDIAESSRGGSGPHGVAQGTTGTGKSFMLGGIVLNYCTYYSPDMLNLILLDFKGNSAFPGFDQMPHVLATVTNLEGASDLLDRLADVIEGEKTYRFEMLDTYGAKDILEYRKKRATHPELNMPPMPDLLVVADEFREFITNNREYVKLFESVAAVGRSLGMHLLLVSQFVDKSIIGNVDSQLGYGISLKVNNESESRAVIDNGNAAHLPSGKGDAIVHYKSGARAGTWGDFRTFHIEEDYFPPQRESLSDHTVHVSFDEPRTASQITAFPAVNQPLDLTEHSADEPAVSTVASELESPGKMRDLLVERLSQFQTDSVRQLWQTPINVPFSASTAPLRELPQDSWNIPLVIGEVDNARRHARFPFVYDATDAASNNLLIVGRPGSGKTTAVEAIIASSNVSLSPEKAQFIVLDFTGAKLREIEEYPQVIGFASRTDEDAVYRYLGELKRLSNVRMRAISQRKLPSAVAYLQDKEHNPVEGDPYGHVFFVVDGVKSFLEAQAQDNNFDAVSQLAAMIRDFSSVGIHTIFTANLKTDLPMRLGELFPYVLPLKVDNPSDGADNPDVRAKLAAVPANTPGYGVDVRTVLPARTFVPQIEPITPSDVVKGVEVYDPKADYSQGIKAMAATVAANVKEKYGEDALPAPVQLVPENIPFDALWQQFIQIPGVIQPRKDTYLLGLDKADASFVHTGDISSSHLIVAGGKESGKTTVIRNVINSIFQGKTPEQARFLFWDPDLTFFNEKKILEEHGMLMYYATTQEEGEEMFDMLAATLENRFPNKEALADMSREDIQMRMWYANEPDLYLIADNLESLVPSGFGAGALSEEVGGLLLKRSDLGLAVIGGLSARSAGPFLSATKPLSSALLKDNAPVIMLDGPVGETLSKPYERFKKHRPGEGRMFGETVQLAQFANSQPWM